MSPAKTKSARGTRRLHAALGATAAAMKLLEVAFARRGGAAEFFGVKAQEFGGAYASIGSVEVRQIAHGPQRKGKNGKIKRW